MAKYDFSARKAQLEAIIKVAEGNNDRKSPERKAAARAQRKMKQIAVFEELLPMINMSKVSQDTQEYIQALTEEHTSSVKLDIQIGDNLIELLQEYKDVRDLYKKILKWCNKNHAEIKGTEIVAK